MDYKSLMSVLESEYDEISNLDFEDIVTYLMESFDASEKDAREVVNNMGLNNGL